ncbi:DNA ligase 1-like [Saccostrea echinata]|uniref:DNA ligase 1-like n=1 Tax=Saccostrea echinata TaxID=191078 RepID=UPI002A80322E|nr:DNA ligase 1-like [Saccostrea echinata]
MCEVLPAQTQLSMDSLSMDYAVKQLVQADIQEKLDSLDIASITVPFKPFEGNNQFLDAQERNKAVVTPNMYEDYLESLTAEDVRFIHSRNQDDFLYLHFQQDFTDETLQSPRYFPHTFLSPVEEVDRESSSSAVYPIRTFLSPVQEVDGESCLSANEIVDVKAVEEQTGGTPVKSFHQQKTSLKKKDGTVQENKQRKTQKVPGTNEIFLERLQSLGAKSNLEEMKLTNRLAVKKSELANMQKQAETAKEQICQRQKELNEVRVTNRLLIEKQQKLRKELEMAERELKKGKSKDKQLSNEVKRMSIDHEKLVFQEDLIIQESQQIERKLKEMKSISKKPKHFR